MMEATGFSKTSNRLHPVAYRKEVLVIGSTVRTSHTDEKLKGLKSSVPNFLYHRA